MATHFPLHKSSKQEKEDMLGTAEEIRTNSLATFFCGEGYVAVWISDSIFWLIYFTPTLSGQCNALPKKVPKELYKRKDSNR